MNASVKKFLLCCALLACLCGLGWVLWAHRRVIKALLCGEELPEAPAGCPCSCRAQKG